MCAWTGRVEIVSPARSLRCWDSLQHPCDHTEDNGFLENGWKITKSNWKKQKHMTAMNESHFDDINLQYTSTNFSVSFFDSFIFTLMLSHMLKE